MLPQQTSDMITDAKDPGGGQEGKEVEDLQSDAKVAF